MARPPEALCDDPFALLEALEAALRRSRQDAAAGEQNWSGLAFRVGDTWLVTPRGEVRESIMPPVLTRVPGARPWLLGLANVRGNLLPVTDLGGLLGVRLHERKARENRVLVLNSDTVPAGFLVDEVAGHRQFSSADQSQAPAGDAASPWAPFVLSAFAREGRTWLAISLHRVAGSDTFVHAGT
ncbi:MAG: purine-binding chemotaxis protein CheW [Gammaproteobacteria bacterium]|nr:purine-binding chemotaxis protein CheW [Gammaproteobacteria bacterium]